MGIAIDVPATIPLDPYQRRDEWRLAVLMVALVVTGIADGGGVPGPAKPAATTRRTLPSTRSSGRRPIRPPRSC